MPMRQHQDLLDATSLVAAAGLRTGGRKRARASRPGGCRVRLSPPLAGRRAARGAAPVGGGRREGLLEGGAGEQGERAARHRSPVGGAEGDGGRSAGGRSGRAGRAPSERARLRSAGERETETQRECAAAGG